MLVILYRILSDSPKNNDRISFESPSSYHKQERGARQVLELRVAEEQRKNALLSSQLEVRVIDMFKGDHFVKKHVVASKE
jgi:hypothetical protein